MIKIAETHAQLDYYFLKKIPKCRNIQGKPLNVEQTKL